MTRLSTISRISIAELCVYTPSLAVAILLSARHGLRRSAGWFYLVLFSVIRILGAALQLATINDPDNIGLVVGSMTLQAAGLSPLILVNLGLLGRVVASIGKTTKPTLRPRTLRLVQLLVLVGLVLSIVGGTQMGDEIGTFESSTQDPPSASSSSAAAASSVSIPAETRAGTALMIAGFAVLVGATATLASQLEAIERGERRLLGAVAAAAPFVLVRIVYSAIGAYSASPDFRWYAGSSHYTDYLIGMDIVMEMCAIAIIEGVGLTVRRLGGSPRKTHEPESSVA